MKKIVFLAIISLLLACHSDHTDKPVTLVYHPDSLLKTYQASENYMLFPVFLKNQREDSTTQKNWIILYKPNHKKYFGKYWESSAYPSSIPNVWIPNDPINRKSDWLKLVQVKNDSICYAYTQREINGSKTRYYIVDVEQNIYGLEYVYLTDSLIHTHDILVLRRYSNNAEKIRLPW
ncbi:MAG: hypothetical protein GXP45_04160 [bacterium]|nr:hypothetical protein [bacterium]